MFKRMNFGAMATAIILSFASVGAGAQAAPNRYGAAGLNSVPSGTLLSKVPNWSIMGGGKGDWKVDRAAGYKGQGIEADSICNYGFTFPAAYTPARGPVTVQLTGNAQ